MQVAGFVRQAVGADDAGVEGAGVGLVTLKMRWNEATTSLTVTGLPLENLMPLRILKT